MGEASSNRLIDRVVDRRLAEIIIRGLASKYQNRLYEVDGLVMFAVRPAVDSPEVRGFIYYLIKEIGRDNYRYAVNVVLPTTVDQLTSQFLDARLKFGQEIIKARRD